MSAEISVVPDHWALRTDTFDEDIFKSIVELNEYDLPNRFEGDDWIIDIGAHTGSFSWACALRGCANIDAFEPEPANFATLAANLEPLRNSVRVHNAAVWRSDREEQLYYHYHDNPRNTGGGDMFGDATDGLPVWATVGLDDIIANAGIVRLLKLDCEGSEFPILYTSRELDKVDEILGEYHTDRHGDNADFTFTVEALLEYLQHQGFSVTHRESEPHLGKFRGVR